MKRYDGYLLDLDGTIYRGNERIEEAAAFVEGLRNGGIPYMYVTNNSSLLPEQAAEKLNRLGLPTEPRQVMTSAMATARTLAEEKRHESVYVIGEAGVKEALREHKFRLVNEKADVVVVGIDREITYDKLAGACLELQRGADFYSTNPDVAFPSERGLVPGNGSLTVLLETASGRKATYVGKPEPAIIEHALEVMGTDRTRTLMVGDNYDTDILAGMRAGLDTLLVHTGVTTKKALARYEKMPTYTADSLEQWMPSP
ncbi:MAG TPA: TIGR01457 family HAD-type hydrolase [Bacillales bacterium]|nr:TIGR01457 family HAD-type hydrolase [Bacillales bacterium]